MSKLKDFVKFAHKYNNQANFVNIYLEEIHSSDGWSVVDHKWSIKQHEKLEDRKLAAKDLEDELSSIQNKLKLKANDDDSLTFPPLPILVDDMSNMANLSFGALPERLAIILKGKLVYLGGIGPVDYSIEQCVVALDDILTHKI